LTKYLYSKEGEIMVTELGEKWVVDTDAMTCLNKNTRVVVEFKKKEERYIGKIKYMPLSLKGELAVINNKEKLERKAVMEAEEIFWMVKYDDEE
jgi:uncharacterized protein (AIM24 family)